MSSKVLNSSKIKPLQPATAMWQHINGAKPKYAFKAKSAKTAKEWQVKTRKALSTQLGFLNSKKTPLKPKRIELVDKGDYTREKVLIQTTDNVQMPVYILLPKGAKGPLPCVAAFHGHGYGVKDIVGLWEDGAERDTEDGYHKDFAVALCRQGFAVAAPEISCFGERQTDFSYLDYGGAPSTCAHTAFLSFHYGGSVIGLRAFDGIRLVDYLETRKEFDTKRLGAMGISGGGMHTFFNTCLDKRIKACVVSGYYCTFKDSVLAMHHCPCNYVPGLAEFVEMYDLVGLIAPRPMLVEAGDHDSIFPIKDVKRSVGIARKVYDVFGARANVHTDYFEGRHRINGDKAYAFLKDKL
jgi:dienelactone hydrolase